MITPTIPSQRTVKARAEVLRLGEWVDVSAYLARAEANLGDHTGVGVNPTGTDGVARTMNITFKNRTEMRSYWPSTLSRLSSDLLGMSDDRIAWSHESADKILEWLFGAAVKSTFRENLAPRDRTSSVNIVDGAYHPLLWANREIRLWGRTLAGLEPQEPVSFTGDGATSEYTLPRTLIEPETMIVRTDGSEPVEWEVDGWTGQLWLNRPLASDETLTVDYSTYSIDSGWKCDFHGIIGGDIRADGPSVELVVTDLSKLLQQAMILDPAEEPYEGPMEDVMQAILAAHPTTENITLYFPSGTEVNPRPSNESPEWYVEQYNPAEMSVWDALGRLASRQGLYVGYRWHEPTQKMQLQLLTPMRWKDDSTADIRLSWMTDFYHHDLSDSDRQIINRVEVEWYDDGGEKHVAVAEDEDSINEYGLRAGRIREDETGEIRDAAAAQRLADAVVADMAEMRGASSLDMPIIPGLDVFYGIALDDPRVSSSEDFLGIENVMQSYDFEGGRFRSHVSGPNRVVGGLRKWIGMMAPAGERPSVPPLTPRPQAWAVDRVPGGIEVRWSKPPESDWDYTEIHLSRTNGFHPTGWNGIVWVGEPNPPEWFDGDTNTLVGTSKGQSLPITSGISYRDDWYVKIVHVDTSGGRSSGNVGQKTINVGSPRGAMTIAASGASAFWKSVADRVCDGVDDEQEINAAFAQSDRVELSEGTFNIGDSIVLGDGQSLQGQGFGTKLFLQDNSDVAMIEASGTSQFDPYDSVSVSALRLDGNKANQTRGTGVLFSDVSDSIITAVRVENVAGHGVSLQRCSDVEVTVCSFKDNQSSGLQASNSERTNVRGSTFSGNAGAVDFSISPGSAVSQCSVTQNSVSGVYISSSPGSIVEGCNISSNFSPSGAIGVVIDRSDGSVVNGCVIDSNNAPGVFIAGADNSIVGNRLSGNGRGQQAPLRDSNIYVAPSGPAAGDSISNNIQNNIIRKGINSSAAYGIYLSEGAKDTLVTNNDLLNAGEVENLYDDGSGTVVIAGNRE